MLFTTFATSALLLAGCSSSKEVASTKAGRIREDDLYEAMKNEPLQGGLTIGETILQQLLFSDIFEHAYGDEVSDEDVEAEFAESADQFGGAEEYEELLEMQGMDPQTIKDNIRLSLLVNAAVKDNIDMDDEALEELYEEERPAATARHILVEDKELAEEILADLQDGADFAELVEEHSEDPGSMETEGVYSFQEGEMMPEFEEKVFELEEGELSTELVETDYGYHIIERLELEYDSFEDRKDQLADSLVEQYAQDEVFMNDLIADLAKEANVKISDDELSGAMQAYLNEPEEDEDEDFELPPELEEDADEEDADSEDTEDESDEDEEVEDEE